MNVMATTATESGESMDARKHGELANFIWSICNLLRGPYKRNEYRKVILPLTVLRRFDCVLAGTKEAVLAADKLRTPSDQRETCDGRAAHRGCQGGRSTTRRGWTSRGCSNDPNQIALNLNRYSNGTFSPNVFGRSCSASASTRRSRAWRRTTCLYQVVQSFANIDLSLDEVDNVQMGYVFEELIRIGAEQANEEAGEHFTPREVIRLMVSLLLSPEPDLGASYKVKAIYDPACGTGGMLSVAEDYLREFNSKANPILYGQDLNDDAWAVCKADMLIKGANAENIVRGDTFTRDGYADGSDGRPTTFDYLLANPPFGVEWKQQKQAIERERDTLGYQGRFGAGTPRINDGSLLFSAAHAVEDAARSRGRQRWEPYRHRLQRLAAVHG